MRRLLHGLAIVYRLANLLSLPNYSVYLCTLLELEFGWISRIRLRIAYLIGRYSLALVHGAEAELPIDFSYSMVCVVFGLVFDDVDLPFFLDLFHQLDLLHFKLFR